MDTRVAHDGFEAVAKAAEHEKLGLPTIRTLVSLPVKLFLPDIFAVLPCHEILLAEYDRGRHLLSILSSRQFSPCRFVVFPTTFVIGIAPRSGPSHPEAFSMLQYLDETAIRQVLDLAAERDQSGLTRLVSELTEPESIELLALLWHGRSVRDRIAFAKQLELSRLRHDTHNLTGIPEYIGERCSDVRSLLLWGLQTLELEESDHRVDEWPDL